MGVLEVVEHSLLKEVLEEVQLGELRLGEVLEDALEDVPDDVLEKVLKNVLEEVLKELPLEDVLE